MTRSDRDFYRLRAEAELQMARAAASVDARVAHRELARRYMARLLGEDRSV